MAPFGPTEATKPIWCIYDIGDDAIIVEGTFIEMEDLIDTMAGNLFVFTLDEVAQIRADKTKE